MLLSIRNDELVFSSFSRDCTSVMNTLFIVLGRCNGALADKLPQKGSEDLHVRKPFRSSHSHHPVFISLLSTRHLSFLHSALTCFCRALFLHLTLLCGYRCHGFHLPFAVVKCGQLKTCLRCFCRVVLLPPPSTHIQCGDTSRTG